MNTIHEINAGQVNVNPDKGRDRRRHGAKYKHAYLQSQTKANKKKP